MFVYVCVHLYVWMCVFACVQACVWRGLWLHCTGVLYMICSISENLISITVRKALLSVKKKILQ